jgi:spore coat protein CotF
MMQWQSQNSSPYNWQGTGQQPSGGQQTGLPRVKGPEMNDRDRINDVLATEKYLTTAYNVAVNEASTEQLYQTQLSLLNELHQCQRDLYNLMQRRGWYKVDQAMPQAISQAAQQFTNYQTQFPYS